MPPLSPIMHSRSPGHQWYLYVYSRLHLWLGLTPRWEETEGMSGLSSLPKSTPLAVLPAAWHHMALRLDAGILEWSILPLFLGKISPSNMVFRCVETKHSRALFEHGQWILPSFLLWGHQKSDQIGESHIFAFTYSSSINHWYLKEIGKEGCFSI